MKKINYFAIAFALILGSYGFAQESSQDHQQQNTGNTPVEWEGAYLNGVSTPNAETTSGIQNSPVQINTNHTQKAYFGSYGQYRPDGTSGFGESLIYTNGPIVDTQNEPDLSVLQDNLGLDSYGFGVQKGSTNSLADDFTLTEDFDISKLDFFLYQTGETTASITAVYVQIWDGDPSAGGSVVWGNLSTNVMDNVVLTNIRRVLDSDRSSQSRKIQKVTAATSGLSLTAGTYYVQATFEGTGSSGPWMPPITVMDEVFTGDALQFTGTANDWQAAVDAGTGDPQGMPFEIYGVLSASNDTCLEINPHYDWVFEIGWTISSEYTVANDVTVDAGTDFTLQTISVPLAGEWPITDLNLVYFEDDNGKPGNEIGSENSPTISSITAIGGLLGNPIFNVYRVEIAVTPFEFSGDETSETTYWIGIKDVENDHGSNSFWASTTGHIVGNESYQFDNVTGDWTGLPQWDGNYTFKGECSDILGLEENQVATLQVYPNPASDVLYLSAGKPIGTVSLYNLLGQEVMQMKMDDTSGEINISHLPVGTYILKNDNGQGSQSHKIIKK